MTSEGMEPMSETWTPERMRAVFEEVKNWGRWGAEDEAGALNLITPEKRREAAAAVVTGETISCARDLAVQPSVENPHPALHMMIQGGDDCVIPGVGLGVALFSYEGKLCWGFNGDAELVPDLSTFVDDVRQAFEILRSDVVSHYMNKRTGDPDEGREKKRLIEVESQV